MDVPEGHSGVITRFGSFRATVGPGRVRVLPLVEKLRLVDMRPRALRVGPLEVETLDGAPRTLQGRVIFQVTEPRLALLTVDTGDYLQTMSQLWAMVARRTATHGRADELHSQLAAVADAVQQGMDPITEKFGVRTLRVELTDAPAGEAAKPS